MTETESTEKAEPRFCNPSLTRIYVSDPEGGREHILYPIRERGEIVRQRHDDGYFVTGERWRSHTKLEEFQPPQEAVAEAPDDADTVDDDSTGDDKGGGDKGTTGDPATPGANVSADPAGGGGPKATGVTIPGDLVAFLDGDTNLGAALVTAGVTTIKEVAAMDLAAEDADVDLINRAKDTLVKPTLTKGCMVEFESDAEEGDDPERESGEFLGFTDEKGVEVAEVKLEDGDTYTFFLRDLSVPAPTE